MALFHRLRFFKNDSVLKFNFSVSHSLNNKWRREQGLEPNPNSYSPLTNLPDYSFLDGRIVPFSQRKLMKAMRQQELCKRIVELTDEIDMGLETYHKKQEEEKLRKETIIKNKLKAKGAALLHHKHQTSES